MKRAQLIGITIAGGAGLLAFILMRSIISGPREPTQVAVPVNATEVLVARRDIPLGDITKDTDFRWQTWPADAVTPDVHHQADGNAGDELGDRRDRALADARRRADHAQEADQGRAGRRARRHPAERHARHLDAHQGRDGRRPPHPAQRPRRRHPHAPRCAVRAARTSSSATRCSATCASWPSASRSRPRKARSRRRARANTATLELTPAPGRAARAGQLDGRDQPVAAQHRRRRSRTATGPTCDAFEQPSAAARCAFCDTAFHRVRTA